MLPAGRVAEAFTRPARLYGFADPWQEALTSKWFYDISEVNGTLDRVDRVTQFTHFDMGALQRGVRASAQGLQPGAVELLQRGEGEIHLLVPELERVLGEWPLLGGGLLPHELRGAGGGDGLALREVLKYPTVKRVVLVDLDPGASILDPATAVHGDPALAGHHDVHCFRWFVAQSPGPLGRFQSERCTRAGSSHLISE